MENLTPQQRVDDVVKIARDSVGSINEAVERMANQNYTLGFERQDAIGVISRNVEHLEMVLEDPQIIELGGDLSDLTAAIANGKAALE